jgi:hypothetical protein
MYFRNSPSSASDIWTQTLYPRRSTYGLHVVTVAAGTSLEILNVSCVNIQSSNFRTAQQIGALVIRHPSTVETNVTRNYVLFP